MSNYKFLALALLFLPLWATSQIGTTAPNFTATDTHGNEHTLYDYLEDGKTVVLDFFFTTCIPCQFYAPQVNLAYEKYGCNTKDVIFISINFDDTNAEVLAYEDEYKIEFPSIGGKEGGGNQINSDFGVYSYPTFFVIDSTKKIVLEVDPPSLQVFDYEFAKIGIEPAECSTTSILNTAIESDELEVFPNPITGDEIQVRIPSSLNGLAHIKVMNSMGQTIHYDKQNVSHNATMSINTEEWPTGFYTITLISEDNGNQIYSAKVVR